MVESQVRPVSRRLDSLDGIISAENWRKLSQEAPRINRFRDRLLYEAEVRGESFDLVVR